MATYSELPFAHTTPPKPEIVFIQDVPFDSITSALDIPVRVARSSRRVDPEYISYGSTTFEFGGDHSTFDTAILIKVKYHTNFGEGMKDCLENRILRQDLGSEDARMNWEHCQSLVLPLLPSTMESHDNSETPFHAIHFLFETTRDDGPHVTVLGTMHPCYPAIPAILLLESRIPIYAVTRVYINHRNPQVQVVELEDMDDRHFIFKSHSYPEDRLELEDPSEDQLLVTINHPPFLQACHYILSPTFFVVDPTETHFRGYLVPWEASGSLFDFFSAKHQRANTARSPEGRLALLESTNFCSQIPKYSTSFEDWPTKHRWATDIVLGLLEIHAADHVHQSLQLDHLIVCDDSHVRMINLFPQGDFPQIYLAPEVWKAWRETLTDGGDEDLSTRQFFAQASNIFTLGLILWAISEEISGFYRIPGELPQLFWRPGYSPDWYQEIVKSCLNEDSGARPSAARILLQLNYFA